MSFKQFTLAEEQYVNDQALKIAAEFLDTEPSKLHLVSDKDLEEKVLDTGKEIKHKFIKMAKGSLVIRLFKALDKFFARIETPTGGKMTYQAA